MTGYSHRTLVDKLGLKPNSRIILLNYPQDYHKTLGIVPKGIQLVLKLTEFFDFIQYFTTQKDDLQKVFPSLKKHLQPAGLLWISWPKGSSNIKTDLNENIIREIGLANGLVDVKVCAVDENWSALKFVYRRSTRP